MNVLTRPHRRRTLLGVVAATALLLALLGPTAVAQPARDLATNPPSNAACETRANDTVDRLLNCLTARSALQHLEALQLLALEGSRASGTPGYAATVGYVVAELSSAGYEPTLQTFDFPFFEITAQDVTVDGEALDTAEGDFFVASFSGSATLADAAIVPVDVVVPIGDNPANTSTSGCEPEDFEPAPEGDAIALVQRGTCTFFTKALNAQEAGYDAVLLFNEGQQDRTDVVLATLGPDAVEQIDIPVVGITYERGAALVEAADATATIDVSTEREIRTTYNVLAELEGSSDDVVMLGAHLDSVEEGPRHQ